MNENQMLEQIERYINGEMTKDERARFEILRNENAELNNKLTEHKHFISLIKQYGERLELEQRLNAIHEEIDVYALTDELTIHPSWIVQLWRNHHSKISVAASIAIFAVLCTLFFTGYLSNREQNYVQLSREVIKTQSEIRRLNSRFAGIAPGNSHGGNPGNFRGTGFAISSNGYIVTNYHVIKDADSVSVQGIDGTSFKAKVFYTEPQTDIAILEITDPAFKTLGAIPYAFKKAESDIGETVFTVGYPRDAITLGPGYLTASTGFNGDTVAYQVSILLNPGNSGGPLLDNKGNLIGIIDAKETNMQGAGFAVKSSYLFKALHNIPADSLKKPLNLGAKNVIANLTRPQQVKKLEPYVFMVKVY